jgi:hypothetical protein
MYRLYTGYAALATDLKKQKKRRKPEVYKEPSENDKVPTRARTRARTHRDWHTPARTPAHTQVRDAAGARGISGMVRID